MTTANDVITRALKKIGILAAGETASAEDAADGLTALNDMLYGLELVGVNLGHSALTLTSTVNLPESHIEGLECMLAVRLGPEFEREASPTVQGMAAMTEQLFASLYNATPRMYPDTALQRMPSMGKTWR